MSGSIKLHPEKGVNPKLTYCPRCGGDARELILIGADEGVYKCSSCNITVFGFNGGSCPSCKGSHVLRKERVIGEHEKLPGSPCENCEKEMELHKKVVSEGGVYFECVDCHASGVIRGTAEIAIAARKKMKIEAPNPLGLEFSKKHGCPKCGQESDAPPAKA